MNEYVPVLVSVGAAAKVIVYVPAVASVFSPTSLMEKVSKTTADDGSIIFQRMFALVDETDSKKTCVFGETVVKVYTSALPIDSISPAPAAGTPVETVSPIAIAKFCAGATAWSVNEYVPVLVSVAAKVIVYVPAVASVFSPTSLMEKVSKTTADDGSVIFQRMLALEDDMESNHTSVFGDTVVNV